MARLAYKFLRPGAIGPFSRFAWPQPVGDQPGPWVEATPARGGCVSGIHALELDHLAIWLDRELWAIELDGEVELARRKLVAPRGRLLRRIEAWTPAVLAELATAAVERARTVAAASGDATAAGYLADAAQYAAIAPAGSLLCAAYVGLTPEGVAAEQVWQSRWLAARLGLT